MKILGGHWNKCVLNDGWEIYTEFMCNITKKLPFDDNSINYLFLEHVIEHVKQNEAVYFFKEAYRCLKPGGILRLVFPSKEKIELLDEDRQKNLIFEHGHQYIWAEKEISGSLKNVGFKTGIFTIGNGFNKEYCIERFRRGKYLGNKMTEDREEFKKYGFFDDESSFVEGLK